MPPTNKVKAAHSVAIRVFCSQEENETEIANGLKSLLQLDLENEKIRIERRSALGFEDRKITILEVNLTKSRHIEAFLNGFLPRISDTDRQLLIRQLDSRVDNEGAFFIRVEKWQLSKHNDVLITDGGNCYHIKIKPAVYPAAKENAIRAVKELLQT